MSYKDAVLTVLSFSLVVLATIGVTLASREAKAARYPTAVFQAPTSFMSSGAWNSMFNQIEKVPQGIGITILWRGIGGNTSLGDTVITKLQSLQQRKPIRVVVNGQAISMHANALCYLANVERRGILTFHATFYRINGKKHYAHDEIGKERACINKGYLSSYDVQQMYYNGKRILLYPNGKKVYLNDWKTAN